MRQDRGCGRGCESEPRHEYLRTKEILVMIVSNQKRSTDDQESKILLLNRSFQHQGTTAPVARRIEDGTEWL